jgi:hypothetical protein
MAPPLTIPALIGLNSKIPGRLNLPEVADYCPEATGPNGPMMGFGRLWCYNAAVQETLGPALAPEEGGNDATVELFEKGLLFSLPDSGTVWVLYGDGRWQKYAMEAVKSN